MMKFLQSIKTTALGTLVLICGGIAFTGVMEAYNSLLMLFCGTATGLGLIAAKDADKTNAPHPTPEAHSVPPPVP